MSRPTFGWIEFVIVCAITITLVVILLALSGCDQSGTPSPRLCRAVGVDVPDGAPITGAIRKSITGTEQEVRAGCRKPFGPFEAGCTVFVEFGPNDSGVYDIWYATAEAKTHEECHALFEIWRHTK